MNTLSREDTQRMLNKVPEVTLFYWAAILFPFALGTAAGDRNSKP